tara:strand:- start:172 stop:384 length:213 start_codon:yes stop_codon:yes gene_type:complete
MSKNNDYIVDKLIKKIQVLLTEPEFEQLNSIILETALKNKQRPKSVSAYVRELIQKEMKRIISENNSETK